MLLPWRTLVLMWFCFPLAVAAQETPLPDLKIIPSNAVALLQVPQPRHAIERALSYVEQLQLAQFDEVQELLQSTPIKRLSRFLQYLEKTYGRAWPALLDEVSGKGITLSLVPVSGMKDAQLLGSMCAKNSELLKQAYVAALEVIKQESEQSDQATVPQQKPYRKVNVTSLGDKLFLAQHAEHFLFASNLGLMTGAIDQLLDHNQLSIAQHARFSANERPSGSGVLAWGWVDIAYFKSMAKEQIDAFKLPTNDLIPQLILGGIFDAIVRSDHAWFALQYHADGPSLEFTTPQGRSVSQEGARMHMHDPAKESILPLLDPPGTLFSNSFYWNLPDFWNKRQAIFKEGALKEFETGEKNLKPFLAGNSLSNLLNALGARHRIVISQQRNLGYAVKPKSMIPSFAVVLECSDAEKFNKMISVPFRAAGLLLSTQVSMKLFEEQYHQAKVVGYRFNENAKNKYNDQGFLFNYSPSFARAGNFFIISSTRELCCDLVDELAKAKVAEVADTADVRHRFSWMALGQLLASERSRLSTELTLRYGGSSTRVEEQINTLLKLLDKLGTLDLSISHSPGFRLELRANYK